MDVKTFQKEFSKSWNELKDLLGKQQAEIKKNKETSVETAKAIKENEAQLKKLGEDLKELQVKGQRPGYGKDQTKKSLGKQFVESSQFKSMKESNSHNSNIFPVKGILPVRKKALTSTLTTDDIGFGIQPERYPEWIFPQERTERVRDLLSINTTTSNAIEYVEEIGFSFGAEPQVEGEVKGISQLDFELKTEAVKTIAHYINTSRQVLDDVNMLQGYIDTRLTYGLALEEDNQLLYGDGISPNLQGILTHGDIQTHLWSAGEVGDTKLDAIRRAMTLARLAEYPVNGIVIHPNDWEDIEMLKTDDGLYIFWQIQGSNGTTQVWQVPVIETTAIAEGQVLLGAFEMGAMLWDREQAGIRIAEQHNDHFTKNLITILAEQRLALTIFRPEAFVEVTFDNEPV